MTSRPRSRWAEAGALGAAGTVAAAIFCCLPFATGIIGAGVAAFGARFAPLQPYLIGLSLASLGYAFYQAYRPSAVTCDGDQCDVLWDSFLLYGANARWDDVPTDLIHWGRTIVAGRETLKIDFEKQSV